MAAVNPTFPTFMRSAFGFRVTLINDPPAANNTIHCRDENGVEFLCVAGANFTGRLRAEDGSILLIVPSAGP